MAESQELIGKGNHGIPRWVISEAGSGNIPGTKLTYTNTGDRLEIILPGPHKTTRAQFIATCSNGEITFDTRTRDNNVPLDPNLFAGKLISEYLRMKMKSGRINKIASYWDVGTNYDEYVKRAPPGATRDQRIAAASTTWTASLLAKFGFRPVTVNDMAEPDKERVIKVEFEPT